MTVLSVHTLAEHLRELHLLTGSQLAELDRDLPRRFTDPKELGRELVRRGWLTVYQVNQLFRDKGKELVLGSYVLLERLGAGGMGEVFKARHRTLDRVCALKTIRKDRLASLDAVNRFLREARAAARLDHPNIVKIYDADQAGGTYYLAMEFVEGTDLAHLVVQQGPLPVPQACAYVCQAALGLQHAHEQGLVHRDIKPQNLLLKADGSQVKVLDFGLALITAGPHVTTLTQEGLLMGTPAYMAPEQFENAHTADIRADIYSLGCSLFYLLTGRPPFAGPTAMEVLAAHLKGKIPSLSTAGAAAPPELDALLRRLLAKKPEERLQTPAEVARALERVFSPQTTANPDALASVAPVGPQAGQRARKTYPKAQRPAKALPSRESPSTHGQPLHTDTTVLPASHSQRDRRRLQIALLLGLLVLLGSTVGTYLAWGPEDSGKKAADGSTGGREPKAEAIQKDNRVRQVAGFSGLKLKFAATVTLLRGEKEQVTIHAEERLLPRLTSDVLADTLVLAAPAIFSTNQAIEIEVRFKKLQRIQLENGGTLEARDVDEEKSLEIAMKNGGSVTLSGRAKELQLTMLAGGTFKGLNLSTKDANLDLRNECTVGVNVEEDLYVKFTLAPMATVDYMAWPRLNMRHEGQGKLKPILPPKR
jgi:serine/threonine protein kinase